MTQQKQLETHQLHFVLIPFMTPGHILPMVDIATLLARQNLKVTIFTTPLNAVRIRSTIESEIRSGSTGLHLQLFEFPNVEAGLPEGCESFDTLPSTDLRFNFMKALFMLQKPLEQIFKTLNPAPTCVIYDPYLPSAASVAKKFGVPGITFDGTNCFKMLCDHNLHSFKVHEEDVVSDDNSSEQVIIVPGLPHKVEFKRSHLHSFFNITTKLDVEYREKVWEAEEEAYGVIVNSFEELESEYLKEYKKVTGKKVYCVGPVSLSIKDNMDKAQRGNNIDSNEERQQYNEYLKWLDSWPARSVIYVCFGSLNCVPPEQLMELGLGLEDTKRPFIMVLREAYKRDEMEKILKEDGLEERVKGRGLIIRAWVPQVLILSHTAIGAFFTHCGWNSTLEGISRGLPLVTFPMFSDQFYNEKVIVDVMKIGVRLGAESSMNYGEEDGYGVKVKREKVKEVIEKVMGEEEESERIRERAEKLAEKANKAMEKGGSSHLNMSVLIQDIMMQKQQVIGLN